MVCNVVSEAIATLRRERILTCGVALRMFECSSVASGLFEYFRYQIALKVSHIISL